MRADRPGSQPILLSLLMLVACGVAWRLRDIGFAVDDAWISFRIARNLVEQGVLTYDPSQPPVEGMTNLLWTLLAVPWIALRPGLDPVPAARILGLLCHLGSIALLARVAGREAAAAGGSPRLAAAVAGGLVASATTMAYSALSGLETGLWGLLFTCALDRAQVACRELRPGAAIACGVCLGALAWTRPEGVLVGAAALGLLALRRDLRPQALRVAAPFAGLVLALCSFRLAVYGSLVPNTFYAKPSAPSAGLLYLRSFWIYGLGIVGPLVAAPALRRDGFARGVALLCLVMILGTVWSGGDWMTGFRRFTVPTLGIFLLMGTGAALTTPRWRAAAAAGVAAVLVAHAVTASRVVQRSFRHEAWARLAALADRSPGVSQVALADVGVFGWRFRGSILDLAGLTDAHIARRPGVHGHKEWDEAYFRRRSPDLVLVVGSGSWEPPLDEDFLVRPFELGALRSIVVGGGYRYHNSQPLVGSRRMLVLVRDDLSLDPKLWGPPDSRDLLAELRRFRERRLAAVADQRSSSAPKP